MRICTCSIRFIYVLCMFSIRFIYRKHMPYICVLYTFYIQSFSFKAITERFYCEYFASDSGQQERSKSKRGTRSRPGSEPGRERVPFLDLDVFCFRDLVLQTTFRDPNPRASRTSDNFRERPRCSLKLSISSAYMIKRRLLRI